MLEAQTLYLTPTPRLARKLKHQHASAQNNAGHSAWHAPAVLTFSAWLSNLRDDYYLLAESDHVPISNDAALLIWQSVIQDDVFVNMPEIAALAQQAWRTVHEYQLALPAQWPALERSEDAQRFVEWAAAYEDSCHARGLLDEWAFYAQLPALIAAATIVPPETIEMVGFDLPATPLQQAILDACAEADTQVSHAKHDAPDAGPLELQAYGTATDELHGAAQWARAQITQRPDASVAIVVPDLTGRVEQVERLLQQALDAPGFRLLQNPIKPWHVSLGQSLSRWPLVAQALHLLALSPARLAQPELTPLLRSPLLPAWDTEAPARNQCLLALAHRAPHYLTAAELQFALTDQGAPVLAERLQQWADVRNSAPVAAMPSQWVRQLQLELDSIGFASGRSLDSRDYQVLQRWHELLDAISDLDQVASPLDRQGALQLLRSRASSIVFRERDAGAAIEVLGIQEALGSRFDALWLTTMDSATWPGTTQRNPLIPAHTQAAVPRATSDGALERATLELSALLSAAPQVVTSYAQGNEEIALSPTPLLTMLRSDVIEREAPVLPPPARAPMASSKDDYQAPKVAADATAAQGGTSLLSNQAACPFRAFALHRLQAPEYRLPRPGLDAGQRGTVVHDALERFWQNVAGSEALTALSANALQDAVAQAVAGALDQLNRRFRLTLSQRGYRLEQQRAERLLLQWLEIERKRPPFTVLDREAPVRIALDTLTLQGTVDRIDRLEDGSQLLIDYKTSNAAKSKNSWAPEPRIADPQLPSYAVSLPTTPAAIAFANVPPQQRRFSGLSASATGIGGISELAKGGAPFSAAQDWEILLASWREHLTELARSYLNGAAAVDPRSTTDCRYCHLQSLCRINERSPGEQFAENSSGATDDE